MTGRLLRAAWLVGLLLAGTAFLVIPGRTEVVGLGACVTAAADGGSAAPAVGTHAVSGLLQGPVTRAGVRQRAVLVVDRPVAAWPTEGVRVRAHAVFSGTAFRVADAPSPGWLCPVVEAPSDPLLRGPGFDQGGIGDRARQTIGPCVPWPPPDDRSLVLDTTDGVLVQTHGLDAVLGGDLQDGRVPWRIDGVVDAAPDGAFVEVLDRFLDDHPLESNTAIAPVRQGRVHLDWRGVPWAEPVLCRWEDRDRLTLRGCGPLSAGAGARAGATIHASVPAGPWAQGSTDIDASLPSRLPPRARLRLHLAARCDDGR